MFLNNLQKNKTLDVALMKGLPFIKSKGLKFNDILS